MCKIIYSLFIAFFLFCLGACTKDADVKLPTVASKLVISSFLSPQDTIVKVKITLSQPIYNNPNFGQDSSVSDAMVQINDGVNTHTLVCNSTENYYSISTSLLPIIVGNTYYLTVSTPDGKNVSASTTIPAFNSTLTFSSNSANDPANPDKFFIDAAWSDVAGTEDFYRLTYYDNYFYPGAADTSHYIWESDNFSDKNHDGSIFNKRIETYKQPMPSGPSGELYLIHASKEYYLFHKTLLNASSFSSPFSEPVPMFSNINRGFGIFAGFNQYRLQVFL